MSNTENLYGSLTRDRKDVSKAIAKDLAVQAYEEWQEQIRASDKKIRLIQLSLNAMRDAAFQDPLVIALKKNQHIDVKNELVNKRCNLLLELKELKDARRIISNDRFFNIPVGELAESNEYDEVLFGDRKADDETAMAEEVG